MSDALPLLALYGPMLLVAIVVHEYAHARVATWQGDPTPSRLGRVTLNPIPHIDLMGTVLLPLILIASGSGFLFGWAKPVPVVPANFRDHPRGDVLVSLAGVAANFALAIACTAALVILSLVDTTTSGTGGRVVLTAMRMADFGIWFNILLGVFNLVPIPPLDGSHVVYHLLPPELGARYRALGKYGILFLLAMFFIPGALDVVLWPVAFLTDLARAVVALLT